MQLTSRQWGAMNSISSGSDAVFPSFPLQHSVIFCDAVMAASPPLAQSPRLHLRKKGVILDMVWPKFRTTRWTHARAHLNPPPLVPASLSENTGSCDIYPQLVAWMFGNIWSTGPGEGPQYTGAWCKSEGRETSARWPVGEKPPLGWQGTAGCSDTLFPWRRSCCI